MKKHLIAAVLAAALAQPAAAITFPSLTTIYVGSGVTDSGGAVNAGVATSFHCTNVSGFTASVRFLVLHLDGTVAGSFIQPAVAHGRTQSVATHGTVVFGSEQATSPGTVINQGSIIIESTESAVFCTAALVDAGAAIPAFAMPLHLVRVNPHPGTVE
jgi:hypothetical protein